MKYINARKIIFLSLMAAFSFCLFSCKEVADSLLEIDSAQWENKHYDRFSVCISDEDEEVSVELHIKKDEYGKCHYTEDYRLMTTTYYKLSRGLYEGEYIKISWKKAYQTRYLEGKLTPPEPVPEYQNPVIKY